MNSLFRQLDLLIKKSEEKHGFLRYNKALLNAVSTILRKPPIVSSCSPHIRDALDLKRYMSIVVISLLPCLFWGIYNTGRCAYLSIGCESASFLEVFIEGALHVVPLILISYSVGGFCEIVFAQVRGHEVAEGFLVTGMLYPLICPATIPWWMFAIGVAFGCIVAKEVFGGTGMNVLNPALTARAFLFFAYPAEMSGEVWIKRPIVKLLDGSLSSSIWTTISDYKVYEFIDGAKYAIDGFTGATPLAIVSVNFPGIDSVLNMNQTYSILDMFLGFMPGSIGETSTLACIIGGVFLVLTGVGSWRIMLSVIIGGISIASLFYLGSSVNTPSIFSLPPLYHLIIGGFMFGAIFMATDPVTSPFHNISKVIYGFLIGALCVTIRVINPAFPEGMMLSILFFNIFASLIDHYVVLYFLKRRADRAK